MILGLRQDPRDHSPLLGDAQALFIAQGFKIDFARHQFPDSVVEVQM
jgi:hypothetical protein